MVGKETHLLIVDDSRTMRKIIRKCLEDNGFTHITEAQQGTEGWQKLEDSNKSGHPIQLIFSDLLMPPLDGIALLKKLRSSAEFKDIPFVLITAEDESTVLSAEVNEMLNGYVRKPFSSDEITNLLSTLALPMSKRAA